MREFRFLDKDLDRIANAESAGLHSARPVRRLGLALIFAALAALFGTAAAGAGATGPVIAGLLIAAFLAISIGASDVANALGPAVGAGAISMGAGLAAVAAAEVAGAMLAGGAVSQTLTTGILPGSLMMSGSEPATVMLAAMLAASVWIALATWAGAPVSTTHAIVGGIAGAGLAVFGAAAPDWTGIARIATGWMVSPLLAGMLAATLLGLLRALIHRAPDRIAAAARWLPRVVGLIVPVMLALALTAAGSGPAPTLFASVAGGIAAWAAARARSRRELGRADTTARKLLDRLFGPPLVLGAVMMGFAHGANDVANVAAPLAVIAQAAQGWAPAAALSPWAALAIGGGGIALGALLFGRRLVRMVGSRITRLNPARALCVSVATALTVFAASRLGLPVSTTHVAVGGVFGVGFYREAEERLLSRRPASPPLPPEERRRRHLVRRGALLRTLAAWAITVPASGALAAAAAWAITRLQ